jgi:hypothetical protein
LHDLKEILREAKESGIQVVLLQGIALLLKVYDDIGLRPMTDIDLWLPRNGYSHLIDILHKKGYQRDKLYPHTFRRGLTTLDIHTHILGADRIGTRTFLLPTGQDPIYRRTFVSACEGEPARCLDRYDQVIYLSLHALKHNVERLLWLADIRNLVMGWGDYDWRSLIGRAKAWGQERSISHISFFLNDLLGFPFPEKSLGFLEERRPSRLQERILRQRTEKGALPSWAHLFLFCPTKGVHRTILYLLETLFPKPAILRQVFDDSPDAKVWELYTMRVLQLLGKINIGMKNL